MKKKAFLLALLCLIVNVLMSQDIKVTGVIKDTIGNPLEFANIIATVKVSGQVESYAITNSDGKYKLSLPIGDQYILKTSFLGFETKLTTLAVEKNKDIVNDVVLKSKANMLEGVELVYQMPVSVRGDTIVYNADSFTTGNERKLADVIKKIPGLEVNEDGRIEIQGKEVGKVMVEGNDFFDGDSKLANQNIPADAIDKVEVLRNYNEVDQMKGLGNDENNFAINIKLKEGKKNFWFGEVSAGVGTDSNAELKYLMHPKLFYYSPKYSLNLITDFNDIGEVPFTFRDYFNFMGGLGAIGSDSGTSFNVSDSDLGFTLAQDDRAEAITTNFIAGNFSYRPNKKLKFNGFGIFSNNSTSFNTEAINSYHISDTKEINTNTSEQQHKLAMLKLGLVYKPSSNLQFDYKGLVKFSSQIEESLAVSETNTLVSDTKGQLNTISEQKENNPLSIYQNVNGYYTLNDKNIFAGKLQYMYKKEDPFYNAIQKLVPFRGLFTKVNIGASGETDEVYTPLQEQEQYNINQDKNVTTHKADAVIDYYKLLNKRSNLNFRFGITSNEQEFNSNIFQVLDNKNRNDFEESKFNNRVNFKFSDLFFGIHYKFKAGKFTFTPGIILHNYKTKNIQLAVTSKLEKWSLLPSFSALFQLKNSESLQFNYRLSAEYSDVANYAKAYVFNNYNTMFRGNATLENALVQRFNLSYNNFNMFSFTTVNAMLSYSSKQNAIKNTGTLVSINQIASVTNIAASVPDKNITASLRYSKRFSAFQLKMNAMLSYGKFSNIYNSKITTAISVSQEYHGAISSNFLKAPNFEIGYKYSINAYEHNNTLTKYATYRPYLDVDVNFLKRFTLIGKWNIYNYKNKNSKNRITNEYQFLEANLFYRKKDSPWEFKLQGTNLLDVKSINRDSFSEQYSVTSQYYVMPRIVMFGIKYNL